MFGGKIQYASKQAIAVFFHLLHTFFHLTQNDCKIA